MDSMFYMARNRHIVSLFHPYELLPFELQSCFPAHYDDPFVLILIVPKTRQDCRMTAETMRWILIGAAFRTGSGIAPVSESSGRFAKMNYCQPELSFRTPLRTVVLFLVIDREDEAIPFRRHLIYMTRPATRVDILALYSILHEYELTICFR